ncbi:MAG: Putative esterase, partial [uncultured Nocardioidaceae bacterium]
AQPTPRPARLGGPSTAQVTRAGVRGGRARAAGALARRAGTHLPDPAGAPLLPPVRPGRRAARRPRGRFCLLHGHAQTRGAAAHHRLPPRRRFRRPPRPLPRQVRRSAGIGAPGEGRGTRLPAGARAQLARLARRPRRPRREARDGVARRRGARRRLGRRRLRAGVGADAAGPRRPPAGGTAAALAVGRPHDQHPGHRRVHRARHLAVPRQDPGLRRVVGRWGGEPVAGGGVAGPRAAPRPAAGADVLRDPRHPRARLPAARRPRRGGGLGAGVRRASRPHPRLSSAAADPRGPGCVATHGGVPPSAACDRGV